LTDRLFLPKVACMTSRTPDTTTTELLRLGKAIDNLRTDEDARVHVGQAILALRNARGLQGQQLAAAVGVDHTVISKIENGKRASAARIYHRIAEVLDVPLADIVAPGDTSGEG
jgi:ribosome-binding protein aMBF1 (putative translation factor)